MPLYDFEGKRPSIDPTAFIAPTAVLVGDVTVEAHASVWYNAVLRGDLAPIVVRRGANVQDCAVVHVTRDHGVLIGAGATVGHLCLIHAATLGEEALRREPWSLGSRFCGSAAQELLVDCSTRFLRAKASCCGA